MPGRNYRRVSTSQSWDFAPPIQTLALEKETTMVNEFPYEVTEDEFSAVKNPTGEISAPVDLISHSIAKPRHKTAAFSFELARSLDRINRRFVTFLQAELTKLGVTEINAPKALILFAIGDDELTVSQLLERGNYGNSNMSHYLKQLSKAGFIERGASPRDKRSARIRLSGKGQKLCSDLDNADSLYHRFVDKSLDDLDNLAVTFQMLRKMDQVFRIVARYGGSD
jgi:DNA-binding MarR family transcriptional regulator